MLGSVFGIGTGIGIVVVADDSRAEFWEEDGIQPRISRLPRGAQPRVKSSVSTKDDRPATRATILSLPPWSRRKALKPKLSPDETPAGKTPAGEHLAGFDV